MAGEAVTVTNGFITSDVTDYVIAVAPSSVGYTLQRPDGKFIYQQGTYNSFNLGATIPDNAFADWVFQPIQDGMFTLVNDKNKKTVKLNFYEKEELTLTVAILVHLWRVFECFNESE